MAVEAQVECPECGGSSAVDGGECPVCDGHGSVEGGVRTISLHNIRYELRRGGDELWRIEGGRETLRSTVARSAGGSQWQIRVAGELVASYEDEETARQAFEQGAALMGAVVTSLQ